MVSHPVTTVILAGGRGVRIGGNKGLQLLQGKPLLTWVLEKVKYASAEVLLNVNDVTGGYEKFGCRVIVDELEDWQGPLAGLQAALRVAQSDWIMTVPCDTPFLPDDLIDRLGNALDKSEAEAVVVVVGGYRQPTIALYRKQVLAKLGDFLAKRERKVNAWLDTLQVIEVEFDDVDLFNNINTPEELEQAQNKAAGLTLYSK